MEKIISDVNELVWSGPFLILLVVISVYVTYVLRFPQFKVMTSFFGVKKRKTNSKKITPYKSLMTVMAGTLGTGNITGVATAIAIGGIGSIFWIGVSGILAVGLSYAENYIVLKYRKYSKYEGNYGGTMYVLRDILDKPVLAVAFCIFTLCATAGIGCMLQANSLAELVNNNYNLNINVVAVVLCIVISYVVFRGKYILAKVSSFIIPLCTLTYIILCIAVLFVYRDNIVISIIQIFKEAFTPMATLGGLAGTSVITVISCGFSRGMFSNEAGMGSAPIFIATTEDDDIEYIAKNAALSVVIDTMFLCVLTGITIVATQEYMGLEVSKMLSVTFGKVPQGNNILSLCMLFFVIATIPCWEYYGEQVVKYLFHSNASCIVFKIVFICCIYIGAITSANIVWDISAIFNALMALPNIYMICKLIKNI